MCGYTLKEIMETPDFLPGENVLVEWKKGVRQACVLKHFQGIYKVFLTDYKTCTWVLESSVLTAEDEAALFSPPSPFEMQAMAQPKTQPPAHAPWV